VREALAAPDGDVRVLFADQEAAARHADLVTAAHAAGAAVHIVAATALAPLTGTVTPQGLVAVCGARAAALAPVLAAGPRLLALLADVRDPGNAGTVIRTADAAGADAVVLTAGSVDPTNGKCVRASAGSLFHLPVVVDVPVEEAVAALRAAGLVVLAADGTATTDLPAAAADGLLDCPTAWLFGNEAWGLPAAVRELADHAVAVPIYGRAESLNLATAAAVCLYASAQAHAGARGEPPPR